ncbi:adenosylcobinamide amidohydrolase [Halovenus salina]|uniref:adenosylcobinamide amidohydrolase n=1 Tax=Halovenus salina TaxID=1510225 RepID=UPI002260B7F8|nr:adenosylcobinamide amidohydrolase [Halovenus salina]
MFEATVRAEVLQLARDGTRWLSSGYDGGITEADAAYNISVPEGWGRTDLDEYVSKRRKRAEFTEVGPALLTGVDLDHARGARHGPVVVYATAGISNPAALPVDSSATDVSGEETPETPPGTVNLIVGTTRALGDGALANLLAVVAEAKSATLVAEAGFPGTTTDAVVVATDPDGEPAEYTGSATEVGSAARACTRSAVLASLRSRYPDRDYPERVEDAAYGVRTTIQPTPFRL